MLRADIGHHRLVGYEFAGLLFDIEGENLTVFFVNELIIAFQCFPFFYLFQQPLLKFELLRVGGGIKPKLKFLLAFPKLLRV